MQQRKAASGRPSGTDGSDFSYRMVVDQRYTEVAEGKARLQKLLLTQAIIQVLGVVVVFLFRAQGSLPSSLKMLSLAIGIISLIIGELGRGRSLVTLLRLYSTSSSMAAALSVACLVQTDFFSQFVRHRDISAMKVYEVAEVVRVAIGVLLQVLVIATTAGLVRNMSPKKRAS